MKEAVYKSEFDHNYLILEKEKREKESFSYRMILQNKIPGLIACRIAYEEEKEFLYYDITAKRSLESKYKDKKISFDELWELFHRLQGIYKTLTHYLLDSSQFLLLPSCLFEDLESEELFGIYNPELIQSKAVAGKYMELAEFLLDKIDHKDEHAVNAAYQFYKQSKEEFFSIESFLSFLEKEKILKESAEKEKEKDKEKKNHNHPLISQDEANSEKKSSPNEYKKELKYRDNEERKGFFILPAFLMAAGLILLPAAYFIPMLYRYRVYLWPLAIAVAVFSVLLFVYRMIGYLRHQKEEEHIWEISENINIDDYFGQPEDEETVFFGQNEELEEKYRFVWEEEGYKKEFILEHFPVTVGKQKEKADIVISDVSVSRIHAKVSIQNGVLKIRDLDSTNGTYVNGIRLQTQEDKEIKRKDKIQFGKMTINVV